jgi:hypothetical protein
MGGGTLLGNSNRPGPIKLCSQSTAGVSSALVCDLPISTNSAKMLGQNHAAQPNWNVLTFLQPILICKCHVLSTSGVGAKPGKC